MTQQLDLREAERLVSEVAKPTDIDSVDVEVAEDATGETAVWVYATVVNADDASPRHLKIAADYRRAVRAALTKAGALAYVRFIGRDPTAASH